VEKQSKLNSVLHLIGGLTKPKLFADIFLPGVDSSPLLFHPQLLLRKFFGGSGKLSSDRGFWGN
jgi:hypothetical protein